MPCSELIAYSELTVSQFHGFRCIYLQQFSSAYLLPWTLAHIKYLSIMSLMDASKVLNLNQNPDLINLQLPQVQQNISVL